MKIRDSVAFVTGANRGIGLAFAQELLTGGARKVYAAARQPERIPLAGVESVRLDVTSPEDVAAAARQCTDVNLLINNAGIALWTGFLAPDSIEAARSEMETNTSGGRACRSRRHRYGQRNYSSKGQAYIRSSTSAERSRSRGR
jgi:NAD(P)-dependent dehydrogenase (short-subunit alcohol dehydrogenase family)